MIFSSEHRTRSLATVKKVPAQLPPLVQQPVLIVNTDSFPNFVDPNANVGFVKSSHKSDPAIFETKDIRDGRLPPAYILPSNFIKAS